MLKRFFLFFIVMLMPIMASAQNATVYPIDMTAMITPPYSTCLKDLAGTSRFQVNVLLRDKARSSDQFVIEMKVSNMSGREVFRSYFGNFQLTPGHPTLLSHELNESVLG